MTQRAPSSPLLACALLPLLLMQLMRSMRPKGAKAQPGEVGVARVMRIDAASVAFSGVRPCELVNCERLESCTNSRREPE